MPRSRVSVLVIGLALMAGHNAALAQGLPSQVQSVVLLNVVAAKGAECGMLRPWEAAIVGSLAEQDTLNWDEERKATAAAETETLLSETNCETPVVSTWIEGARPGIASEYLSLYIVVYRTLLEMDDPPQIFEDLAMRDTPDQDIAAIDDALAAMEASGARPDGGGPWPEFVERMAGAVHQFSPMLDAGEAPPDVAFLMPEAITISELWLADGDAEDATP
jgi:hypothetical protein